MLQKLTSVRFSYGQHEPSAVFDLRRLLGQLISTMAYCNLDATLLVGMLLFSAFCIVTECAMGILTT